MQQLRQFAASFMILAVLCMISAPLMACEAAGHRCAMTPHASKPAAPVHAAKHACCPKEKEAPVAAQPSCHGYAAVMLAEYSSRNCCNMGNAPLVSVVQADVTKRSTLAVVSEAPPEPFLVVAAEVDRSLAIPRHARPVLDLKADFRI